MMMMMMMMIDYRSLHCRASKADEILVITQYKTIGLRYYSTVLTSWLPNSSETSQRHRAIIASGPSAD